MRIKKTDLSEVKPGDDFLPSKINKVFIIGFLNL